MDGQMKTTAQGTTVISVILYASLWQQSTLRGPHRFASLSFSSLMYLALLRANLIPSHLPG